MDIGQEEVFHAVAQCDIEHAKSVIDECDSTNWDVCRFKSDKLRYYNLYKYDKSHEDYLHLNISRYQRSLFAQFRCGILPLEIEVGRYRDVPLAHRLCKVCKNDVVEDEIHFLCQCSKYSDIRNSLYAHAESSDSTFHLKDDIDKFVFLMSNLQKQVIRYLYNAVTIRTNYLNKFMAS